MATSSKALKAQLAKLNAKHQDLQNQLGRAVGKKRHSLEMQDETVWLKTCKLEIDIRSTENAERNASWEAKENQRLAKEREKAIKRDPNRISPSHSVGYRGKDKWEEYKLGTYEKNLKAENIARVARGEKAHNTHTNFVHQEIDGYIFIPHALQRMKERGLYASQVIEAIQFGTRVIDGDSYKYSHDGVTVLVYLSTGHISTAY